MLNDGASALQESMQEEESVRQELTQIVPETGITQDFKNQFNGYFSMYKSDGLSVMLDFYCQLGRPKFAHYEEIYDPMIYANAVTTENQARVRALNLTVDRMNQIFSNIENFDEGLFIMAWDHLINLIYGEGKGDPKLYLGARHTYE